MTEKLQDTENEAMAKIVELEKQLMHKNKDLDSIRVRVFKVDSGISTYFNLQKVMLAYLIHITKHSAEQT